MNTRGRFPHSPRDVFRLGPHEALAIDVVATFFKCTGRWRYPARASGDLETMRFLDKVYWLHKSGRPIRRAARGSGLEAFFRDQDAEALSLPERFDVECELSVSAVGDLMSHPYLARSDGSLYQDVAELIFGADIAMANLECVVCPAPDSPMEFTMTSGPALVLAEEPFRVVTGFGTRKYGFVAAACNHSLDFGEEGVASTIHALRARGIAFHGINESEEDATRATILDRNGLRLGLVSYCFGLNGRRPPRHRPGIVNRLPLNAPPDRVDFSLLETQIRHCRREGVDFVIAQLHWGMEYEFYPRPEQLELAHRVAELGVDAIVGHHPHVLQPVEYYRTRRDSARVVPVYYSLGNLTNPFSAPEVCRGGVARLDLVKGRCDDGKTRTYLRRAHLHEIDQVIDGSRDQLSLRPARA